MKFSEFLNEISFFKIKKLYKLQPEDVVKEFKELFSYSEDVKLIKVQQGGQASNNGDIKYSSIGILIHELLHLLQFKSSNDNRYKEFKLDKESFINYVLQRKELNNQAISVAFSLTELNLTVSDFKNAEYDNSSTLSTTKDRLNFFFYNLNAVKSNRKIDLYKRISKYREYILYLDSENKKITENVVTTPYTFI